MNITEARIRNLKMKFTHWVIEENGNLENGFNDDILKNKLFFKQKDIEISMELFDLNSGLSFGDKKFLKEDVKKEIKEYVKNYENYKDEDESELEELYIRLKNHFNYNKNKSEYEANLKRAIEIIDKLHWKYLPIYLEQYILNNGYLPENVKDYYNHFHAIEDLYWYIFTEKKIDWKNTGGDINLNCYFNLKIYTTRWEHYDNYRMKRTTEGWEIDSSFPAAKGFCEKNGKGSFTNLLKHDSVFYPEDGVLYALEKLWQDADIDCMSVGELEYRIYELSEWIKEVEIATHKYQPKWCGYY